MNAEVQFELNGVTKKYSVTPDGTVYEVRKTGWRRVPEFERQLILQGLRESRASISA